MIILAGFAWDHLSFYVSFPRLGGSLGHEKTRGGRGGPNIEECSSTDGEENSRGPPLLRCFLVEGPHTPRPYH